MTHGDALTVMGAVLEGMPVEDEIVQRLCALEELQAQQEAIRLAKQVLLDQVLTPEIKVQIAEIGEEYAPQEQAVAEALASATEAVKQAVLVHGKSVSGEHLQAVYVRGRESWDSRALQGYAAAHPEVLMFQHIGEPSVSIRRR